MSTEQSVIRVLRALLATMVIGLVFSPQGFAQSAPFQRGDHVRMKEQQTTGLPAGANPSGMVLTVVAVGGDHIRVTDSALYVNDVVVSGFSQNFIARLALTEHVLQTVPEGRYFLMGEGTTSDGRPASMHGTFAAMRLESAQ
jgi:hypothetical protein